MKKLDILIIEESAFFLRRFRKLIPQFPNFRIVGEAQNPISALKFLYRMQPDAIIMDVKTQLRFGIDIVKSIRAMRPMPSLIVLTCGQYATYQDKIFEKVDFLIDKFTEYHLIPEILEGLAVQGGYRLT